MKAGVLEICARNPSNIRPFTHKKSARLVVHVVVVVCHGGPWPLIKYFAALETFLDQKQTAGPDSLLLLLGQLKKYVDQADFSHLPADINIGKLESWKG